MTRDELILQYERLAWKEAIAAKGWAYSLGTVDDIAQVAFLGLINAADKFDPTRGAKFITYATTSIRNTIRRAVNDSLFVHIPDATQRAMRRKPNAACRLQRAASSVIAIDFPGDDKLDWAYDRTERLKDWSDIQETIRSLPKRSQRVIRLRFFEALTLAEIAGRLSLSKQRVQQIIEGALDSMRRRFDEPKRERRKRRKFAASNNCETLGCEFPDLQSLR